MTNAAEMENALEKEKKAAKALAQEKEQLKVAEREKERVAIMLFSLIGGTCTELL